MVCSSPAFFLFLTCPSISRARVTYPHLAGALWMFPFRSHCPLITRIDANKREDSGTQPSHSNHPHLPTTSNNPRSAVHLNLPELHEQACRYVPENLHGQACWYVPDPFSLSLLLSPIYPTTRLTSDCLGHQSVGLFVCPRSLFSIGRLVGVSPIPFPRSASSTG